MSWVPPPDIDTKDIIEFNIYWKSREMQEFVKLDAYIPATAT